MSFEKWISVKDQLPDDGELVFYYFKLLGVFAGEFSVEVLDPEVWGYDPEEDGGPFLSHVFVKRDGGLPGFLGGGEVTHWMPREEGNLDCPDPPE